jgi:hypothetical protein
MCLMPLSPTRASPAWRRSSSRNPSGDLLALRERQCQSRATPYRRTNPTVRSQLEINRCDLGQFIDMTAITTNREDT